MNLKTLKKLIPEKNILIFILNSFHAIIIRRYLNGLHCITSFLPNLNENITYSLVEIVLNFC